jgi:hypothetical protein
MILNTAGKSATARRQPIAGTSGVVDTGGKSPQGSLIPAVNHLPYPSEYSICHLSRILGSKMLKSFVNFHKNFSVPVSVTVRR